MYLITIALLFIGYTDAIEIPAYFPRCSINDPHISNCIVEAANKLRPMLIEGVPEISLISIKPVTLRNFKVNHKGTDARFTAGAKMFNMYGIHHYDIVDLEFRPNDVLLRGVMKLGDVHAFSDYFFDGHVVNIPILGNGFFKGLIGPANITFVMKGDLVNIGKVQYCKLRDVNIKLKISNFIMSFDGLTRETGPYGDTNEALKQQSKQVARAMEPVFEEILKRFVEKYLEWFLSHIPYASLFPHSYRFY